MNLHQFSFTNYDDESFGEFKASDGSIYPMNDEGIVTQDQNFFDVVVHDHQKNLIQECYDDYLHGLGMDKLITATVIPNYYGSVFILWSSDDQEELEAFLNAHLISIEEENLVYHNGMEKYEAIVEAYQLMANVNEEEDKDIAYEMFLKGCEVLGFNKDSREEWENSYY